MTDCARCKRTLDATETQACAKTITQPGKAYVVWCADCILKSPPNSNER